MTDKQVKSKRRVLEHGEVFTSPQEVNAMLDLVWQETQRIESRFLEPACGHGNFLVGILARKLNIVSQRYRSELNEWSWYAVIAVSSIYGIDILEDNIIECRERLFHLFDEHFSSIFGRKCNEEIRRSVRFILQRNILHGDALTLTLPGQSTPIIFSEWSPVKKRMLKRRDFTLANLLANQPMDEPNLFSDLGDKAFLPTPVAEFPLEHFLKIGATE